jgi:50S ribosomal protein L16 3-hydroxylase
MDVTAPRAMLGGLSAGQFMRRHWQKRPLLVRQALPGIGPPLPRSALFALAGRDDVESRLVVRRGGRWTLRHGPIARRSLPPLRQPAWTLLVQGMDLHVSAAHDLLARFRFVPDARLDDLMTSYASDGGGVGPHQDAYDVFLVQVHGRRRWRIGRVADDALVEHVPLKLLRGFVPEHEWVLEPGDLLYLPPRWGHDGVALGECMTCSVGFRSPPADELASEVLARLSTGEGVRASPLYRDPAQPATAAPARIPPALQRFTDAAVRRLVARPHALEAALGEALTEPKPRVWFEAGGRLGAGRDVRLDARTRMMYDERHLFVNGESYRTTGRDAALLRRLADERRLPARGVDRLGTEARTALDEWVRAGWLRVDGEDARSMGDGQG